MQVADNEDDGWRAVNVATLEEWRAQAWRDDGSVVHPGKPGGGEGEAAGEPGEAVSHRSGRHQRDASEASECLLGVDSGGDVSMCSGSVVGTRCAAPGLAVLSPKKGPPCAFWWGLTPRAPAATAPP